MRNNEEMFARRGNKLYIHADSLNKSKLVAYSDVEEICFCDNLIKETDGTLAIKEELING